MVGDLGDQERARAALVGRPRPAQVGLRLAGVGDFADQALVSGQPQPDRAAGVADGVGDQRYGRSADFSSSPARPSPNYRFSLLGLRERLASPPFAPGPPRARVWVQRVTHEELRNARSSERALTL